MGAGMGAAIAICAGGIVSTEIVGTCCSATAGPTSADGTGLLGLATELVVSRDGG